MNHYSRELVQKQYDTIPYPNIPIENSPKDDYNALFIHNLVTPYYLYRQKVADTTDKLILDVGCGSGFTTLILALANPNARIVAIDLSAESLKFAEKRLKFHGFENVEYHQMPLEEIASLGQHYDYINCNDVLYLCESPTEALKSLQSVLKPEGIIRGNFHSYYQRFYIYLAQELCRCLGLLEDNPGDFEIGVVAETFQNLRPEVILRRSASMGLENKDLDLSDIGVKQRVLNNILLQGDKGYNIPQVFEMLREAKLEFLSMTNWRHWEVRDLFQDKNKIPTTWEFVLENATEEERLHLFELLHPSHRLIDFWCVNRDSISPIKPLSEWDDNDWERARIHLHPQLKAPKVREDLLETIKKQQPWEISKYITQPAAAPVYISHNQAAALLPLFSQHLSFSDMVEYWLKIQPINLITGETKTRKEAREEVKILLKELETFLYVLVEKI
ncbi:MAG: class I SAM-dependent methyltransferase [Geminocystis sp.]|nr:class I SAM-dependent methyltransferase [Geminocystis sp.]HIK37440.1 methyltransferase domain-containing protein [Geminocystis sp. M7585_C2015_104]